jgi:predicted transcriptional regulator
MRRPAPQRDMPPPLELECLKTLWAIGEGTVHDVRREMAADFAAQNRAVLRIRR